MKIKLSIIAFLMVLITLLNACGSNNENNGGGGVIDDDNNEVELSGKLDIYLPINPIELGALNDVANAYMDINNKVEINIEPNSDPVGYINVVKGKLQKGVDNAYIVQTNVLSSYYGTDKIVDLAPYLEEENKYGDKVGEDYPIWKDLLEEDAYRTEDNGGTIPALSYENNYVVAFYDKRALDELKENYSEIKDVPTNWQEFMTLLQKAKEAGFENPLGVNINEDGLKGVNFSWLLRMYQDQYFRDVINTVHSQENDYSYISKIDSKWEFNKDNPIVDLRGNYTYNLNKLIDEFFNKNTINSTSERYENMMKNFYDLIKYSSSNLDFASLTQGFNNTVLYYNGKTTEYTRQNIVYIARFDMVSDYLENFSPKKNGKKVYFDSTALNERLGWFLLPAMDSYKGMSEASAPASKTLRSLGGPNNHLGIVNSGNQQNTELAVDFLKFLFSKQGQEIRMEKYSGLGVVTIMPQLVKNVEIDEKIDLTYLVDLKGDCDLNPYNIFGYGYSNGDYKVGQSAELVKDQVAKYLGDYFKASTNDWTTYGNNMFKSICDGFSNYANSLNLKFTDYKNVSSATNNLTSSPFNK